MARSIRKKATKWLKPGLSLLMVTSVAILMVGLISWQGLPGGQIQLKPGDVAPYNVVAPSRITYESQVLTEGARQRAADTVPDQYDAPEGRIRRQQVSRARDVLEFISIVRSDPYATPELQADYLLAIPDLKLNPEAVTQILSLSDQQWSQVVSEVPAALDRAMRGEIREDGLEQVRTRVPGMIAGNLDDETSAVTEDLVSALLQPNSLYNPELTESLRNQARDEVPVQTNTIEAGEVVIRAGDIADEQTVEAIDKIGLLQENWDWWVAVRAALFTLALLAMTIGLLYRLRPATLHNLQEQAILAVLLAMWLVSAKFMVIPHDWLPYLYAMAAFGMLATVLVDLRAAVILTILLTLFVHYLGASGPVLIVYLGVGTLTGSIILGRADRLTAFLWAAVAIIVSNFLVIAAYGAPFRTINTQSLIQMSIMAALNGGLSASIALIGYFVIGNLFGITTSLQLTELSRPTHPLLRQLLLKSPGTYHHTIVVSNMAERAAAAIGADAFLTRVGAYYHDIGKTVRPYFFTENIADGDSPHDKLDPYTSAQIIISHVTDGLDLADKYRLPPRIRDFIREHHGTSLVKYFYYKALKEADDGQTIDEADFRYPGPNPRSKETAILMLADTCEAAVRAVRPPNRDAMRDLVNKLIDERIADGELDESNLTFRELQTAKSVFLRVLEGVNHPRISYPEPEPARSVEKNEGDGTGSTVGAASALASGAAPLLPEGGVVLGAETSVSPTPKGGVEEYMEEEYIADTELLTELIE